jgi:hypothetical protein
LPDVVIVRKSYAKRSHGRRRKWALKQLDKERDETAAGRKHNQDAEMRDMEDFARVRCVVGWVGQCVFLHSLALCQ